MLKINDRELLAHEKNARNWKKSRLPTRNTANASSLKSTSSARKKFDKKSLNALKLIQAEKEVIESQLAKPKSALPTSMASSASVMSVKAATFHQICLHYHPGP